MMGKPIRVGLVSVIVLAFVCGGIYAFTERGDVAQATPGEVDTIVGVDADPTGNTATSLGTINSCISVNSTDTFNIDLVIQDVTDLNLWDATFRFDESVLEVNWLAVDGFFLGSDVWPTFQCYEDPVGDEGECSVGNFDTTYAGHDGEGVLGRLEITAIGPGISPADIDLRPPVSGIVLRDPEGTPIGDDDGDGYFDGDILNAEIAVDEYCPGECEPGVDTDGDGFNDDVECYLPTDQYDACPNNPSHDAWPLDMNNDTIVNLGGDVVQFVGTIGSAYGEPNFRTRLDLNADGIINLGGDVVKYVGHIGETCS
jgi:hypothetical protein